MVGWLAGFCSSILRRWWIYIFLIRKDCSCRLLFAVMDGNPTRRISLPKWSDVRRNWRHVTAFHLRPNACAARTEVCLNGGLGTRWMRRESLPSSQRIFLPLDLRWLRVKTCNLDNVCSILGVGFRRACFPFHRAHAVFVRHRNLELQILKRFFVFFFLEAETDSC